MNASKKISVLVLPVYRELSEEFLNSFISDSNSVAPIQDLRVDFDVFAADTAREPKLAELLSEAAAVAIVVRFLDVLSLEKIKNIYRSLPDQLAIPVAIFMLREKGEADFKISCQACGQKLWVRDTDVGKRGRCPNCTKPFSILSQADHMKSQLILPEKVEIFKVTRGTPESFQDAFVKLLGNQTRGIKPVVQNISREALKNATVRIQIQDS